MSATMRETKQHNNLLFPIVFTWGFHTMVNTFIKIYSLPQKALRTIYVSNFVQTVPSISRISFHFGDGSLYLWLESELRWRLRSDAV